MTELPIAPKLYEAPHGEMPGQLLSPETAGAIVATLKPEYQDMLALEALGLAPAEMAPFLHIAPSTAQLHLSKRIYPLLGIRGGRKRQNIQTAREIAWTGSLLTKAFDSKEENHFAASKEAMRHYGIGKHHAAYMDEHGLTMAELALVQMVSERTNQEIGEKLSLQERQVEKLKKGVWRKVGLENAAALSEHARQLGTFALSNFGADT